MQIRREVLKITFHDWSTTWTAIEVSLTNIPYFLSAYRRYDPHRIFGEHQNVCNSRAKGEWFTNFSGQNKRKTIFNFIWIFLQWKNRRNLPNWLCFTAKRSEDYSIQRLRHVMVSCQSSHSMTSCPQQIAVPFAVCIFGGFGEMPWRPLPPKIQGCRIDQQIQRWLKDQLQDSIANKGMAWPSRHATTIRHNIEIFQVILSNLLFR